MQYLLSIGEFENSNSLWEGSNGFVPKYYHGNRVKMTFDYGTIPKSRMLTQWKIHTMY